MMDLLQSVTEGVKAGAISDTKNAMRKRKSKN